MNKFLSLLAVMSVVVCSTAVAQENPPPAAQGAGSAVLTDRSMWRAFYTMRTPLVATDEGAAPVKDKRGQIVRFCRSPLPPADWAGPDFDDSMWVLWTGKRYGADPGYGERKSGDGLMASMALLCLRGTFQADAPERVAGLSLSISYRGGFVAYLNGKEVARGHLPEKGELTFETLASEYPAEVQRGLADRIRRAENIAIPPDLLRKGGNVLCVEIHRPPHPSPAVIGSGVTEWSACGLVRLELCASGDGVEANVGKPAGVQLWQVPIVKDPQDWEYCGLAEAQAKAPVRIAAVRNGRFTAQVAVAATQPVQGLRAEVSDLVQENGAGRIPAAAVKVLYYDRGRGYALTANPSEDLTAKRRPDAGDTIGRVWLKAAVPADVPAGLYRGKLAVRVGQPAATVEKGIELKVFDWNLPRPQDYATLIELMQSPESVALYYNVPLWSDEHFKHMEPSFALMGEAGSRVVHLPLIGHTNLGNAETIVRWIRKPDGSYDHDFKPMERYLDLALKYLSPKVVCLYLYDLYLGCTLHGEDNDRPGGGRMAAQSFKIRQGGFTGPKVSLLDPATGLTSQLVGPPLSTPEARTFWKPVIDRVRAELDRRGLGDKALIGITSDIHPLAYVADFFADVLPGVNWFQHSHEASFFLKHARATMGYCAHVYGAERSPFSGDDLKLPTGWARTDMSIMYPREHCCMQHHGAIMRRVAEWSIYNGWRGTGRYGVDFWPVLSARGSGYTKSTYQGQAGRTASISARYPESSWAQLNMHTQDLAYPGPDGAEATTSFERMREGIQDCEMHIFLEKVLLDPAKTTKLGEGLTRQVREVLNERRLCFGAAETVGRPTLDRNASVWCEGEPWAYYLPTRLMSCAEEVAKVLGE